MASVSGSQAAGTGGGRPRSGDPFAGRVAIVTGGGSGIGAALVRALAARGATVVVADVDEAGAAAVAERAGSGRGAAGMPAPGSQPPGTPAAGSQPPNSPAPGSPTPGSPAPGSPAPGSPAAGQVSAAVLDVRDAAAVADLVSRVVAEHGSLDLMFNNAGIAIGGLVEELTLDHWDRVIDVNVRGVVHGVHAAYPVMIRQGHGHIVNTASLAGLVPGPSLAPYAAAKHAVVGMSLSLRAEAAGKGVRVSAICPGFVNTPLLGRVNPDLPQTETGANAAALARRLGRLYEADLLAQDVLRGIAANKALIVAPGSARFAWRMARYAPGLTMRTIIAGIRRDVAGAPDVRPGDARAPGGQRAEAAAEPGEPAELIATESAAEPWGAAVTVAAPAAGGADDPEPSG